MKVSIIVCTYNRSQSLVKTLDSIASLSVQGSVVWEAVIVDNNSSDATQEVVQSFCHRFPDRFRYVCETRQGLSYARNRGIHEADGDILAFTDDDIVVEAEWLRNLTTPLKNPAFAAVQGRILPANEFSCPDWLALRGQYNLGGVLALHDPEQPAGESSAPVVGANMCFRREMFERHGMFRTDLGRCADSMIGNEDTEFGRRLLERGERLWYEPSAIVHHAVSAERLKKSYFLKFFYAFGRAYIREFANRNAVVGLPRWLFSIPRIIFNVLPERLRQWLFAKDPQKRFFCKCNVWRTFGQIAELPRLQRGEPKWNSEKAPPAKPRTGGFRPSSVSGEASKNAFAEVMGARYGEAQVRQSADSNIVFGLPTMALKSDNDRDRAIDESLRTEH